MKAIVERRRAAAAAGRIETERCTACDTLQAAPRETCAACGAAALVPAVLSGRGHVAAITTIHRAPTPDYRPLVPYAIALVDLAEGVRMMGHAAPGLAVGDAVTARTHTVGERPLALFEPAGDTDR